MTKTLLINQSNESNTVVFLQVKFHFVAKLLNDEGTVLDDSRRWNQPMELIFGKKFKVGMVEVANLRLPVGRSGH